ncbi:hypothetical protein N9S96_00080 [Flavobacteriales bacterium]|nr:hypothetical protein [Flavobacteriales bacterium]
MRKIKSLFILLTLLCFFSCEQEAKLTPTSSSANPVDYEFTIKLNGVTHKIQGNTSITVPITGFGSNGCYSQNYPTLGHYVILDLNDASATNYINGQTLSWNISFDNLLLGNSIASVSSVNFGANSYLSSFIDLIGGFNNGSLQISSVQTLDYTPIPLTFNITDLGTPTVQNPNPTGTLSDIYIWGESLKGNFSGTVYAQSDNILGPYDIPFQLEIDFEVIRYGY